MVQPDESELVRRAQAGDREAFAHLVSAHRPLVLAMCRRVLGMSALAEDVVQDAILQALLSLGRLRQLDRFGPWLAGIGLNLCRVQLRERARALEASDDPFGGRTRPEPIDPTADPAELAAEADLSSRVRAAVVRLPTGQRAAVLLYYLAGLSQAEVAAALNIEVGAVKTRLHKARLTLRVQLESLWMEETMTEAAATQPVEVHVTDVRRADSEGAARHVVLLEEVGGERALPIWVGQAEADALVCQLERIEAPRPQTHDFTMALLRAARGSVREVTIARLIDAVFYATVTIEGPSGVGTVDARPSDALNLAIRAGAPIRVAAEVLARAGVARDEVGQAGAGEAMQHRSEIAAGIRERLAAHEAQLQREREAHADETPR